MRAHLASSGSSTQADTSLYVSVKIDGERPGASTGHASSAVKLRKGAIQRSIACVRCHSAVCAERLACDFGAVVYRRSFRMSR